MFNKRGGDRRIVPILLTESIVRNMPLTGREGQKDLPLLLAPGGPPSALEPGSPCWEELAWLLSTQAVTMGLLGRTDAPNEERIFLAPQSGVRVPLTLRTEGECFKSICHSYSTKILFSHACCWLPGPTPICCLCSRATLLSFPTQHESEVSGMGPTQRQKEFDTVCATGKETRRSLD